MVDTYNKKGRMTPTLFYLPVDLILSSGLTDQPTPSEAAEMVMPTL